MYGWKGTRNLLLLMSARHVGEFGEDVWQEGPRRRFSRLLLDLSAGASSRKDGIHDGGFGRNLGLFRGIVVPV